MWRLRAQSPVCYRLSSVYTVITIFQHAINLWNSSSQDAVMASSLNAFKRDWTNFWASLQ